MRISDDKIDEIRAAADIVDVVSGFVRLRKAGRNFQGLCPFHKEKTPSFNVNPDRGIFKCFGCGRGGNAITFLMEMERISFHEALQELAARYNIDLPSESAHAPKEAATSLDALYDAMKLAASFYYTTMRSDRGTAGAEYFKRRKWTADTQRAFGLGYAPDAWDAFITHARAEGADEDVLERAGLIVRKDSGHAYDRFRNRVIFPIFSVTKKVIAFGARALSSEEQAKYLNSPETPIYVKSNVLYGLSHAHRAIREQNAAILVEGYADVISMHQAGLTNTVATSGTALTPEQIRILSRYTSHLFFLYDADAAGMNAMMRGIDLMLDQNVDVRLVTLPQGEDPDSFVLKEGADAVRERLDKAQSFLDFVVEDYRAKGRLDSPEGKTEAVRHVVGMLARIPDRIKRELYVHHLADRFRVYESVLYRELDALISRRAREESRERLHIHERDEAPPEPVHAGDPSAFEIAFLRMLLESPRDVQNEVMGEISIGQFRHPVTMAIVHLLFEQHEHTGAIDARALEHAIGDNIEMMHVLAGLLVPREHVSPHWSERQIVTDPDSRIALLDAYKQLLCDRVDEEAAARKKRLQFMAGDDPGMMPLLADVSRLERLKVEIGNAERFDALPHGEIEGAVSDAADLGAGSPAGTGRTTSPF